MFEFTLGAVNFHRSILRQIQLEILGLTIFTYNVFYTLKPFLPNFSFKAPKYVETTFLISKTNFLDGLKKILMVKHFFLQKHRQNFKFLYAHHKMYRI